MNEIRKLATLLATSFLLLSCGNSQNPKSDASSQVESSSREESAAESVSSAASVEESVSSAGSSSSENKKIDFKNIDRLLANTVGANGFGIRNPLNESVNDKRRGAQLSNDGVDTRNLWVKTSTIYDSSETSVNDDGTINVSFTETIKNESLDEVTVTKTIRINYTDFEINVLSTDNNGVLLSTEKNREYRVLCDNTVLLDWTSGSAETLVVDEASYEGTRLFFDTACDYKIESRLTNVDYTFQSLEGDRYSLSEKESGTVLFEDIIDNGAGDSNEKDGLISFGGLSEGVDYVLSQEGIKYTVTVEQSEVNGVVDKLYTTEKFTFISFVPESLKNLRPSNNKLRFDRFGISNYDRQNYYSDGSRQSFVVNNESGKVYKITNFKIKEIEGGLIYSASNSLVYDIKTNENDELVFYPLFTNSDITVYSVFKDKFGHSFIQNDKINVYDPENDVTFYAYCRGNLSSLRNVCYCLTSKRETFVTKIDMDFGLIGDVYLIGVDGQRKELSESDGFDIAFEYQLKHGNTGFPLPFKVEHGIVEAFRNDGSLAELGCYDDVGEERLYFDIRKSTFGPDHDGLLCFVPSTKISICIKPDSDYSFVNLRFVQDGVILFAYDRKVYAFYDTLVSLGLLNIEDINFGYESTVTVGDEFINDPWFLNEVLIEDVDIDWDTRKIMRYGINGNTYFDYAFKEENGKKTVEVFEEGTRVDEVAIVVLQPLN